MKRGENLDIDVLKDVKYRSLDKTMILNFLLT